MLLTAASEAATDSKPLALAKFAKHHGHKKVAHRHARGSKSAKADSAAKHDQANDDDAEETVSKPTLPPPVADAHAELSTGDTQSKADASTLTEADKTAGPVTTSDGVQIAASDQLNDMDRDMNAAPAQNTEPAPVVAPAAAATTSVYTPVAAAETQQMSSSEAHSGVGDKVSLIGKIFVAFGTMLTLASAVRLLISRRYALAEPLPASAAFRSRR
jgi:hypothetical protein